MSYLQGATEIVGIRDRELGGNALASLAKFSCRAGTGGYAAEVMYACLRFAHLRHPLSDAVLFHFFQPRGIWRRELTYFLENRGCRQFGSVGSAKIMHVILSGGRTARLAQACSVRRL